MRTIQMLLAVLATAGEPHTRVQLDTTDSASDMRLDERRAAFPDRLIDDAQRLSKLYGYTLLDALEELAVDPEFVRAVYAFMQRVNQRVSTDEALQRIHSAPDTELATVFAGIPPDLALRAIRALRVTSLLNDLADQSRAAATPRQGADDFVAAMGVMALAMNDPTVPATERLVIRQSLRGVAASAMFAASTFVDTSPFTRRDLFLSMVDGLESSAEIQACSLNEDLADVADEIFTMHGLMPINRQELLESRRLLAQARQALDEASEALDGDDLILPPDPHFDARRRA